MIRNTVVVRTMLRYHVDQILKDVVSQHALLHYLVVAKIGRPLHLEHITAVTYILAFGYLFLSYFNRN